MPEPIGKSKRICEIEKGKILIAILMEIMDNLFKRKIIGAKELFESDYLNLKILYLNCFGSLPDVNYISQVDGEKAFNAFSEKYNNLITQIFQYHTYDRKKKVYAFYTKVVILKNNSLIEFQDGSCEILHNGKQTVFLDEMAIMMDKFVSRPRKQPLEINLIVQTKGVLELKALEIKRTKLDLNLFYEDDFINTDELVTRRLNKKNDKGIVLLHGIPGSGKTSYLRYLVGKIKKKVMFLSPSVAANLMDPDFIELLISNPNAVLIIEDAENIIMDRKNNSSSAVSNLLNVSDGLMADFLNVQIICTFNSSLTMVDNALLRKGRLIAKYEFGKLTVGKAQRLSNHFGYGTIINRPMTIAELSNQHEKEIQPKQIETIGFRTRLMEN